MTELDLIIDAGHGGRDPGAVKFAQEKDWTLKISQYQFKRFKELGVSVGMTRSADTTLTEDDRVKLVQQAKYCFSNHLNAGGGNRGEVIHSIFNDGKLAHLIANELKAAGQSAVKVYTRQLNSSKQDYYYMHRRTGNTITNIIEYCFIDNEDDYKHFEQNWEAYAEAPVKAFCEFVNHKYVPPNTSENEVLNVSVAKATFRSEAIKEIKTAIADGRFTSPHKDVEKYSDEELQYYMLIALARRK